MADSSSDHKKPDKPRTVREKVLYDLKVDIKYGDELRDGISDCLEKALGVSKDALSEQLRKVFDNEVKQMSNYFPFRMKKFARNKFVVIKKSPVFFSKKIELIEAPDPAPEAANVDAPEAANFDAPEAAIVDAPVASNVTVSAPNVDVSR